MPKGGDAPREDDSTGYALAHDPESRSLQLKLREYALTHESELLSMLESSADARQRVTSANALGYARKSTGQVAALVRASRDPDDDVRNEAIRALGVLASSDHRLASQIPATNFIDMINSGTWSDRNKGSFLLLELTRNRNPALLTALQTRPMDSLIEMSKWRSHELPSRFVLGRIAGIPEERLLLLVSGQLEPILDTLPHPLPTPRREAACVTLTIYGQNSTRSTERDGQKRHCRLRAPVARAGGRADFDRRHR